MTNRKTLPSRRITETHKVKVGNRSVFVCFGYYKDGTVGEVFIDTAKAGTEMKELISAVGKLASLALQLGATPAVIAGILNDASENTIPNVLAKMIVEECIHPDHRNQENHQIDVTMEPVP